MKLPCNRGSSGCAIMGGIEYEEQGAIGIVTLNRPEKMNALSTSMLEELARVFHEASEKRSVRVIIVRGAGKCFSTGHDLGELLGDPESVERVFRTCYEAFKSIREAPQPVIAQVHGHALAAGCQLVAACDLAVASEDAVFGLTGINLGLFCYTPTVMVARNIGVKRVFELAFTGETIDAKTALEWGLVNRVVPREKLEEETRRLAERIAVHSLEVLERSKRFFYRQLEMSMDGAMEYAIESIVLHSQLSEAREGIRRFLEARAKKTNR